MFEQFGINYNDEKDIFKKGNTLIRVETDKKQLKQNKREAKA